MSAAPLPRLAQEAAAAARLEHGKLQMAGRLERMAPSIPAPSTGPSARRATCTGTAADHRGGGTALAHRHTTQSWASVSGAAASRPPQKSPRSALVAVLPPGQPPTNRIRADQERQRRGCQSPSVTNLVASGQPLMPRPMRQALLSAARDRRSGVPEVDTIQPGDERFAVLGWHWRPGINLEDSLLLTRAGGSDDTGRPGQLAGTRPTCAGDRTQTPAPHRTRRNRTSPGTTHIAA